MFSAAARLESCLDFRESFDGFRNGIEASDCKNTRALGKLVSVTGVSFRVLEQSKAQIFY